MADRQFIEVRGARENNLKDVSLDIPKQQITVFTGVSGSGKSSLVFDTIAAEAQRQPNETFTAFVQGFLPSYGQPDVDSIEHLNAPAIIDQKRVACGSRPSADRNRAVFEQFTTSQTCPVCHGGRLNEAALNCRINGKNIAELSDLEATELIKFLEGFTEPVAKRLAARLTERLRHLVDIGLGYLSLSRETSTLSGGESQRLKMIRHLGNSLTEMLYILDEPSVGLHARDVARLNNLLRKLRDKGNTVLVVEHDPDVIAIGDHIVDLGPQARTHGGEGVFEGHYEPLKD